ncbi:MAG: hypothetical protein ACREOZ_04270, partial [Gloeomargaritales cyanobacterium]
MAADSGDVWEDITIALTPEKDCQTCQITMSRAKNRSRRPMTDADKPMVFVFLDLIPNPASTSITPRTYFSHYLLCVCRYSRQPFLHGLSGLTTQDVLEGIQAFAIRYGKIDEVGYFDFKRIQTDAGPQFTSKEFKQAALTSGFRLTIAAPRHQEQNAYCERTFQTIRLIAHKLLLNARAGEQYLHHALLYATDHIFPVIPWKNLQVDGRQSTPYEMVHGHRPHLKHLRVLFCPCIVKKHMVRQHGQFIQTSHIPQRGIRGVFIGFASDQAGSLIFIPSTRQIIISADIAYDETFSSALTYTDKPFRDAITLRPSVSYISRPTTTHECTGDIIIFATEDQDQEQIEEGRETKGQEKDQVDHEEEQQEDIPPSAPRQPQDDKIQPSL